MELLGTRGPGPEPWGNLEPSSTLGSWAALPLPAGGGIGPKREGRPPLGDGPVWRKGPHLGEGEGTVGMGDGLCAGGGERGVEPPREPVGEQGPEPVSLGPFPASHTPSSWAPQLLTTVILLVMI